MMEKVLSLLYENNTFTVFWISFSLVFFRALCCWVSPFSAAPSQLATLKHLNLLRYYHCLSLLYQNCTAVYFHSLPMLLHLAQISCPTGLCLSYSSPCMKSLWCVCIYWIKSKSFSCPPLTYYMHTFFSSIHSFSLFLCLTFSSFYSFTEWCHFLSWN